MIDTHLIFQALMAFAICAVTAVLISAAIIAVAAMSQRRAGARVLLTSSTHPADREPASR